MLIVLVAKLFNESPLAHLRKHANAGLPHQAGQAGKTARSFKRSMAAREAAVRHKFSLAFIFD